MTQDDKAEYSHDTGAIRDVADDDMLKIATDISDARRLYLHTGDGASVAFTSAGPSLSSPLTGIAGGPFAVLERKWSEASNGLIRGMEISWGRVGDAARSLRRTADNYAQAEVRNNANLEGLARQLDDK